MVVASGGLVAQPADDGYTRYLFQNGNVSSEGYLVDGKPEGWWKTYYEDGTLRSEGNRSHFKLDSLWKFYGPDGNLMTEIHYRDDKKHGPQIKYASDGSLLRKDEYLDDLLEGISFEYHPNDNVKSTTPFIAGKEQGRGYEYTQDGRIVSVLQYGEGMLRSRTAINRIDANGMKQGPWKEFHANGKVKWEGTYVDDQLQGITKDYDATGNLRNMEKFDLGKKQEQAAEAVMLDLKNTYHTNGKVASIGSYTKDGRKHGLFREFSADSAPVGASIYNDDRLLSEGSVNTIGAMEGHWVE